MNVMEKVLNFIPAWGSDGITLEQLSSKLPELSMEQVEKAVESLFKSLKIESITRGEDSKRYRYCNGVK